MLQEGPRRALLGAVAKFDLPLVLIPPLFERAHEVPKRAAWRVVFEPYQTFTFNSEG